MGVPTLGCQCAVCLSANSRDRRLRPSALVRWIEKNGNTERAINVLIDTGPDFREQALASDLRALDAVLYTHSHADHILGLDDLRPLSFLHFDATGQPIPLYATPETRVVLEHVYSYTFSPDSSYTHRARVRIHPIGTGVTLGGLRFTPVPVLHGTLPIIGYRFGSAAYLTDVSAIPESSFALLEGVEVLVLSALRHKPHPSHATLDQAVAWATRIGAPQTWFTHISHDLGHEITNKNLPAGMALAHDGLTIEFMAQQTL